MNSSNDSAIRLSQLKHKGLLNQIGLYSQWKKVGKIVKGTFAFAEVTMES
jgi:hypothetical protein